MAIENKRSVRNVELSQYSESELLGIREEQKKIEEKIASLMQLDQDERKTFKLYGLVVPELECDEGYLNIDPTMYTVLFSCQTRKRIFRKPDIGNFSAQIVYRAEKIRTLISEIDDPNYVWLTEIAVTTEDVGRGTKKFIPFVSLVIPVDFKSTMSLEADDPDKNDLYNRANLWKEAKPQIDIFLDVMRDLDTAVGYAEIKVK